MSQQGQVFELKTTSSDGNSLWAYRYRSGGRSSRRVQRGGFETEKAATDALGRALDRLGGAPVTATTWRSVCRFPDVCWATLPL